MMTSLNPAWRMAALQGIGMAREMGSVAGLLVDESLEAAERVPLLSDIVEAGRGLGRLTHSVASRVFPGAGRLAARYNHAMATWRQTGFYLESVLAQHPHLRRHPQWLTLMDIITGPTSVDAEGFPQLVPVTYNLFRDQVPHLFGHGLELLNWLHDVEGVLNRGNGIPEEAKASILRGVKALKTMTLTASVTAPSDLWLLKQILSTHRKIGTWDDIQKGIEDPKAYAEEHGLEPNQFSYDLEFLRARGFSPSMARPAAWIPSPEEIELGYRLMEIILERKQDDALFEEAGLTRRGQITDLGRRVLERGSGVFGIIGAYRSYLNQHEALLRATGSRPWVERGPNIFASRDANRKNFQEAVAALARFMEETGYRPVNVIEHALGLGVAIQEFAKRFGTDGLHFFGADYEEAALERARAEKEAGRLPADMDFIQADIGLPDKLLRFIREKRGTPDGQILEPTVMIVGNGFHEVRHQTDERMVKVFEAYREAGLVVIFVEESGLNVEQLRRSAWNSYHAGFRWVHQTSGQGLRAPWPSGDPKARLSWSECAERAGYEVVAKYTKGTRPLLPLDLPRDENPQISITYFCVPKVKAP